MEDHKYKMERVGGLVNGHKSQDWSGGYTFIWNVLWIWIPNYSQSINDAFYQRFDEPYAFYDYVFYILNILVPELGVTRVPL